MGIELENRHWVAALSKQCVQDSPDSVKIVLTDLGKRTCVFQRGSRDVALDEEDNRITRRELPPQINVTQSKD